MRKLVVVSSVVAFAVGVGSVMAASDAEILERIRPIGKVNVEKPAPAPAPAPAVQAEEPSAPATQEAEAASAAAETEVASEASVAQDAAAAPAEEAVAAAGGADAGKKVYDSVCFVCHMAGVSGAPKLGDKAAWAPRIEKGMDVLLESSINGIPGTAMPPRGTCAACSDEDLKAAVEYMVSTVQ